MKHYKHILIAFFATVILGTPWLISNFPQSTIFIDNIFGYVGKGYAAVFSRQGISVEQLHKKYEAVAIDQSKAKIHIMIVPGHEPNYGGAEFGGVKEREMAVTLGNYLRELLKNNSNYDVTVARTNDVWNPDLEKYFKNHWNEILSFVKDNKSEMARLVNNGSVTILKGAMEHGNAPKDVATRLYGINKWNNENGVDIAIHIHFNDHPRPDLKNPGKYTGISIYVPEVQYSNGSSTKSVAENVLRRLSKYNAISNLPIEDQGLVPGQELIAIGSYNTLSAPSMLIEYGYIFEPQFVDPVVRESVLKDLAFQTYLGIQDFFGSGNDVSLAYDTLTLPYLWKENINKNSKDKVSVFALQSAMIVDGVYPPNNKTKNECPRSGRFGPCTLSSLELFQNKHGIKNEKDVVGDETRRILNSIYSSSVKY